LTEPTLLEMSGNATNPVENSFHDPTRKMKHFLESPGSPLRSTQNSLGALALQTVAVRATTGLG
jgi:hypothetical protein